MVAADGIGSIRGLPARIFIIGGDGWGLQEEEEDDDDDDEEDVEERDASATAEVTTSPSLSSEEV